MNGIPGQSVWSKTLALESLVLSVTCVSTNSCLPVFSRFPRQGSGLHSNCQDTVPQKWTRRFSSGPDASKPRSRYQSLCRKWLLPVYRPDELSDLTVRHCPVLIGPCLAFTKLHFVVSAHRPSTWSFCSEVQTRPCLHAVQLIGVIADTWGTIKECQVCDC